MTWGQPVPESYSQTASKRIDLDESHVLLLIDPIAIGDLLPLPSTLATVSVHDKLVAVYALYSEESTLGIACAVDEMWRPFEEKIVVGDGRNVTITRPQELDSVCFQYRNTQIESDRIETSSFSWVSRIDGPDVNSNLVVANIDPPGTRASLAGVVEYLVLSSESDRGAQLEVFCPEAYNAALALSMK